MRTLCYSIAVVVVFLAACLPSSAQSDKSARQKNIGNHVVIGDLETGNGRLSAKESLGAKATVVVFFSFECPVSNSYVSPLGEMQRKYAEQGVNFLGICVGAESLDEVRRQAKDFRVEMPLAFDPAGRLVRAFDAEITPEAFLLDASGKLRYRGRIDNGYAARLKRNRDVTEFDLRNALDALLAGKEIATPVTEAVGCPISLDVNVAKQAVSVTYHRDVAPILQKNCQSCHRPGEVGPFSLLTYRQAVRWSADVKDYTKARKMPPWMPTEGPAFQHERKMTDKEIATLARWVDAGCPEGNPADAPPVLSVKNAEWRHGTPDLILEMPEPFHLDASGRDVHRCFVIPTKLTENKWVTGFEVKPGNPRIVHHTLNFYDLSGQARKLQDREQSKGRSAEARDFGPGYSVAMGVGFFPPLYFKNGVLQFGGLGGWAPGQLPQQLPKGTGMFLAKDSDFVLQVHYHRNGRAETDRTQVGLYFAKKPVAQPWQVVVVPGLRPWNSIPPGKSDYKASGTTYLHDDAMLHNITPHMHLLGKSVRVTMTPPGGSPQVLIGISEWDYNWQETYWFKEPILAKAGTKIEIEAVYDNSDKNRNNPSNPPKTVFVGEQTTNEMLFAFIGATSAQTPWKIVRFLPIAPFSTSAKGGK